MRASLAEAREKAREGLIAGIRWLDLSSIELRRLEAHLSEWEVCSLDPKSWREYQAAKARLGPEVRV